MIQSAISGVLQSLRLRDQNSLSDPELEPDTNRRALLTDSTSTLTRVGQVPLKAGYRFGLWLICRSVAGFVISRVSTIPQERTMNGYGMEIE